MISTLVKGTHICRKGRGCHLQCDQIGRFIGLWATFQSFRPQLICPNLLHSKAIFVKVSKSFIFLVTSFLGNFYRHLAIFTGHTAYVPYVPQIRHRNLTEKVIYCRDHRRRGLLFVPQNQL